MLFNVSKCSLHSGPKPVSYTHLDVYKRQLYSFTGYMPKWGMITGVRPAKTASELSQSGYSDNKIIEYFENRFYVSHQKALLALNVSKAEREILLTNSPLDVSLYIGIPFCPTRSPYCSFTSYPIDKYSKKADEYINKLAEDVYKRQGVFCVPGSVFGSLGEGYVRVALVQDVEGMKKVVESIKNSGIIKK